MHFRLAVLLLHLQCHVPDPMRKSRFTDEQIIAILKEAEGGLGTKEVKLRPKRRKRVAALRRGPMDYERIPARDSADGVFGEAQGIAPHATVAA